MLKIQQSEQTQASEADACLERSVEGRLCCSILLKGKLHIAQVEVSPRAGRIDPNSCLKASFCLFMTAPAYSHTLKTGVTISGATQVHTCVWTV